VFLSLPTLPCPISFMTPRFNYAFIYPESFFVAVGFPYFCCFCSSGIKKTYASHQSVLKKSLKRLELSAGNLAFWYPFHHSDIFWSFKIFQKLANLWIKKHNRLQFVLPKLHTFPLCGYVILHCLTSLFSNGSMSHILQLRRVMQNLYLRKKANIFVIISAGFWVFS